MALIMRIPKSKARMALIMRMPNSKAPTMPFMEMPSTTTVIAMQLIRGMKAGIIFCRLKGFRLVFACMTPTPPSSLLNRGFIR